MSLVIGGLIFLACIWGLIVALRAYYRKKRQLERLRHISQPRGWTPGMPSFIPPFAEPSRAGITEALKSAFTVLCLFGGLGILEWRMFNGI